jgi:hypothetical protein
MGRHQFVRQDRRFRHEFLPTSARPGGGNGVFGVSTVPKASGVFGAHNNGGVGVAGFSATGIGVQAGGKTAGKFNGPVNIEGDLQVSGKVTAPVSIKVGPEPKDDEDPPKVVVLTINGLIDWKGPKLDPESVASAIHLNTLPIDPGGPPVGTPNWFQAVQLSLLQLDARVQWALEAAWNAGAKAERALDVAYRPK